MDEHLHTLRPLQIIARSNPPSAAHWMRGYGSGYLLLVQTADREPEAVTELITQWVLRSPFHLIAAGDWLPEYDDLRYSVFRYTDAINETLDNMSLVRARTCFQVLDLLKDADRQNRPVLILDFLHHFYNQDVQLFARSEILEQCCQYTKRLSLSNPVAVLVPKLDTEEYRQFLPVLAALANEIIEPESTPQANLSQGTLF